MSYHHLGICLKNKQMNIYLPEMPSDLPLKQIEFQLDVWKPLVDVGYIPFGDYEDGWGPVCFDIMNRNENDDCPIIWFDHEELFNSDFEKGKSRLELDKMKKELYSNFQELMNNLCGK